MFCEMVREYGVNQPIFLSELIEKAGLSRPRVNQLIREHIEGGQLARFSDGVYYIPSKTLLGDSNLDVRKVIDKKYLAQDGRVFGIYSGLTLLNSFGLTTQVASIYEIVTNRESTRVRETSINGLETVG